MAADTGRPEKLGTPPEDRPVRRWISHDVARALDDFVVRHAGRATGGVAVPRILLAYIDWLLNLAISPGRQLQISEEVIRALPSALIDLVRADKSVEEDPRFANASWRKRPYAWIAKSAVAREQLVKILTAPLPGMDRHNAELVSFYTSQMLNALSPSNGLLSNPEVAEATWTQRGRNVLTGLKRAVSGVGERSRDWPSATASGFKVGENLAATPGTVVFRNELIELLQYAPTTQTVHPEPILIIPAWIMKYYILDLSAQNSMVRWLVGQGHTVFMVSWKNPVGEDRDLEMDDYYRLGVLAALEAVTVTCGGEKTHAVGYCVGGTLLSIAAAKMARDRDDRLKTVTLLTAQTDFEDAGELKVFIDEMSLHWLDRLMERRGYLEGREMASAFGLLRSRELIWSALVRRYLLGAEEATFDIMAWNADVTRMPHRMHSRYLRQLYVGNELAQGKYKVGGESISIGDIRVPLFAVATTGDHIAPWKSVYKVRNLKRLGETTFVLTTGGHNAGIVSEPGRPRRKYQLGMWDEKMSYQSAEQWAALTADREGSWWLAWQEWLAAHSGSERNSPPSCRNNLGNAPGSYVFQR